MIIEKARITDLADIKALMSFVSEQEILPELPEEGKLHYKTYVMDEVDNLFVNRNYFTLKALSSEGDLLGFGTIRDSNYITYLFVQNEARGAGIGKALLNALLKMTNAPEIELRSSLKAARFYQSCGFEATDGESVFNGIRFIPMRLIRY
ncbi:GNAT family N-acetyltransferase [Vibrio sp.]|nr:GNAT family N-acetyltransferase [Vibrio sp.]